MISRNLTNVVLFLVCTSALSLRAMADEPTQKNDSVATTAFVVHVDEYELSKPIADGMSNQEILKLVADADERDDVARVRTNATTTIAGIPSKVTSLQMKPRFTGSNTSGRGATARSFEDVDLGTTLEVLIEAHEAGLALEVKYSVSTMLDSPDPEVPEAIDTTSVQTTLSVRPGEPQLCAVLRADKTTIITVRIER